LDSLLKLAIEHGGLNVWNKLESLPANVLIGGTLWDKKQLPSLFKNARVELKLQDQHVTTHVVDIGERIVFTPNQISLETELGRFLDVRIDPRSAFAGQFADSKWDKLHVGYFWSYALWGYLMTPFLYTYPASRRTRLNAIRKSDLVPTSVTSNAAREQAMISMIGCRPTAKSTRGRFESSKVGKLRRAIRRTGQSSPAPRCYAQM
jgi:hypothetical protein